MYYSINDGTYWYEVTGKGPAVVLLHGFTGSSATWKRLTTELQVKFQVITIDLPGHGRTKMDTPRSMEACCNDLAQLLNQLELSKVHLLGYSMGGRTALSFAALYPEYVQTLTLESASAGLELAAERKDRIMHDEELAKRIERKGIEAFVDFWEDIPLFQTQKQLSADVRQAVRSERLGQTEAGLAQSLRYMGTGSQPSWWGQLGNLTMPVLLIAGELDTKFVKINEKLKKRLKSSYLAVVENTGHAIHVERPDFFGRIVKEFILNINDPIEKYIFKEDYK